MDRRTFIKLVPAGVLASSPLAALGANSKDEKAPGKVTGTSASVKPGDHKEYMKSIHNPPGTDPFGLDGKHWRLTRLGSGQRQRRRQPGSRLGRRSSARSKSAGLP